MVVERAVAQPQPEPEGQPDPVQYQPPVEADDSPVANETSVDYRRVMKKLSGITATITMLKNSGSPEDDLKNLISEQAILERGIDAIRNGNITQEEFLRRFKEMSERQERVGILDKKIANITATIETLQKLGLSGDDLRAPISEKEFLEEGVKLVLSGNITQDYVLDRLKTLSSLSLQLCF